MLKSRYFTEKITKKSSDRGIGDHYSLREVQELANEDPDYKDLSNEQIQSLKNALQEHRDVLKAGARPTNHSAAQDVRRTTTRIGEEVSTFLLSVCGTLD